MIRARRCLVLLLSVATPLAANAAGRAEGKPKKGELRVVSGRDGKVLQRFKGGQKGDEFGNDVGFDALPSVGFNTVAWAVGAPGAADGSGRFFALDAESGRRIWWVEGSELAGGAVERFGEALVNLGHINSDSAVHWAVGAPGRGEIGGAPGTVVVVHAPDGELVERLRIEGSQTSMLGWRLAASDDVPRGDSIVDHFVATAPGEANGSKEAAGAVHRFSALDGSQRWTVVGKKAGQQLGYSLGFVDDVDGDELVDHVVGGPGDGKVGGVVLLLSSASGRTVRQIKAPADAELFGSAVARVDVDGDGVSELAVGAPATDTEAGADVGAVYLYAATNGSLLGRLEGESPGQWFGASLGSAGDIDGDGLPELLVGSLMRNESKPKKDLIGAIDIVSPASGASLLQVRGKRADDRLGWRLLSGRLDWNDDGVFDLLVTAPRAPEPILPR